MGVGSWLVTNILNWLLGNIWGPIIITVAALIYYFNPWDIIPDPIPIFGRVDDYIVLMLPIAAWGYYINYKYISTIFADPTLRWFALGVCVVAVLFVGRLIKKKE